MFANYGCSCGRTCHNFCVKATGMRNVNESQKALFKGLSAFIYPEENMARWLAKALSIDYSNAYRRIRGETELNMTEIGKISRKHPQFMSLLAAAWKMKGGHYVWAYDTRDISELKLFVDELSRLLEACLLDGGLIKHNAGELPYFLRLELAASPRSVLSNSSDDAKDMPQPVRRRLKNLLALYDRAHSVEVWHHRGFHNYIDRLKHETLKGTLCRERVLALSAHLKDLLQKSFRYAEMGRKPGGGIFKLYWAGFRACNESLILDGSSVCLIHGDTENCISMNYGISRQHPMNNLWQEQLKVSQKLSEHSAFARQEFFDGLIGELSMLQKFINGI